MFHTTKAHKLVIIFVLAVNSLVAQDLPEQINYNEDSTRLIHGGVASTGFYDETIIRTVNLVFQDTNFWQLMLDNYNTDNYVLASMEYEGESYENVAVQFKGQTSFQKAIEQGSEKLSFSVKLDEVIDGQDIDGYNNLNFNNAFQDRTFMREVLYGNLSNELFPALKGNFIRLYLNGEDWGLYTSIQQLNGDHIKEWFMDKDGIRWRADKPADGSIVFPDDQDSQPESVAMEPPPGGGPGGGGGGSQWGDGTAALNWLGEEMGEYQEYYTLKDSDMEDPWRYLIDVCDILNNTSIENVHDSLAEIMDIDAVLWFLARENAFSDDDSYIHKGKMDYYLYLNEETGLMQPMEFDGNSVMMARNAEWSPFMNEENENYPLLNVLLSLPELRQRYIAHMKTILNIAFSETKVDDFVNKYEALIGPVLETDSKINFSMTDHETDLARLKYFFGRRKSFILSHEEFQYTGPHVSEVGQYQEGSVFKSPESNKDVVITCKALHEMGVSEVNLYFSTGLTGRWEKVAMSDDGIDGDTNGGDGIFSATIPGQASGSYVRYYIEAVANDAAGTISFLPERAAYDVFIYRVGIQEAIDDPLRINEIMASNDFTIADEAGEFDDWIEIYNTSEAPVSLSGYHLSDNVGNIFKWAFPDVTIEGFSYLMIWADEDQEQGNLHSNFKLSAGGEEVILTNADSAIVDRLVYGQQISDVSFGRLPNATGPFTALVPTFEDENIEVWGSVSKERFEPDFLAYPNPTTGIVYIKGSMMTENDIAVYNAHGKMVYRDNYEGVLDLSHLPSGFYFLRNGTRTVKLLLH